LSAEWDIGKLFRCKKDIFIMPTQQLAIEEYLYCRPTEVAYLLNDFRSEHGDDVYHIPAGKPFMVIYGQDGSQIVKVLYEDKTCEISIGTGGYLRHVSI
jgi:hypothetical protein